MNRLELEESLKKYSCIEECPVRNVISRFTGKWSILILCVLSENPGTRFSSIERAIPDISPKVLSSTLRTLEQENLIRREMFAEIPPRVEYSLTEKGRSLMPILFNLISWALENRNK
ncbi:MAG: helix-turn-helix transcriptional regulator [Muribaculaceae bacterium]|nr:helix-turn-helix transcriptional regulator [Muribaculaceae bacterium]